MRDRKVRLTRILGRPGKLHLIIDNVRFTLDDYDLVQLAEDVVRLLPQATTIDAVGTSGGKATVER